MYSTIRSFLIENTSLALLLTFEYSSIAPSLHFPLPRPVHARPCVALLFLQELDGRPRPHHRSPRPLRIPGLISPGLENRLGGWDGCTGGVSLLHRFRFLFEDDKTCNDEDKADTLPHRSSVRQYKELNAGTENQLDGFTLVLHCFGIRLMNVFSLENSRWTCTCGMFEKNSFDAFQNQPAMQKQQQTFWINVYRKVMSTIQVSGFNSQLPGDMLVRDAVLSRDYMDGWWLHARSRSIRNGCSFR